MSNSNEEAFQLWNHFEESFSRSGEVPTGESSNEQVFRAIVRKNNARSSEALAIQGKADPLLALRAYIYRGQLVEAQKLAADLVKKANGSLRTAEILLEQARILALSGEWKACETICDVGLGLPEIAPVSQLTLFQIRSLARFETAQMMAALSDLEKIDSLADLFPNCPSAFYGAILRARIVARDRSSEAGSRLIKTLWDQLLATPNANLDRVHALIRAELDLERLSKNPNPARLLASYRISEITGEKLYLALGALEAAFSGISAYSSFFQPIARDLARTFPKLQKLLLEIDGVSLADPSMSGQSLASMAKVVNSHDETQAIGLLDSLSSVRSLFIEQLGVVIHLDPFKVVHLDEQIQLKKSIQALAQGPLAMELFFAKIWGKQKYSAELHSTLISSLLYRLKKKSGVIAKISGGKITLEQILVIL